MIVTRRQLLQSLALTPVLSVMPAWATPTPVVKPTKKLTRKEQIEWCDHKFYSNAIFRRTIIFSSMEMANMLANDLALQHLDSGMVMTRATIAIRNIFIHGNLFISPSADRLIEIHDLDDMWLYKPQDRDGYAVQEIPKPAGPVIYRDSYIHIPLVDNDWPAPWSYPCWMKDTPMPEYRTLISVFRLFGTYNRLKQALLKMYPAHETLTPDIATS